MTDRIEVGKRIRSKRLALKMTQEDVAKYLGISKQAVNNYETGDSMPRDKFKVKLARLLQSDIYDLFFA